MSRSPSSCARVARCHAAGVAWRLAIGTARCLSACPVGLATSKLVNACGETLFGKRKIAELGVAWPRRFCGVRALCPLLPRCPRQWLMRVHAARAKRVGVHYYDCVSSVALDRFCVSYLISPVALDRFCVSYQIIMFYVACAWSAIKITILYVVCAWVAINSLGLTWSALGLLSKSPGFTWSALGPLSAVTRFYAVCASSAIKITWFYMVCARSAIKLTLFYVVCACPPPIKILCFA